MYPCPLFRAVIVDDEAKARENVKALIEEYCPEIELVSDFSNPGEALSFLINEKIDLLFLDIRMPQMSGFEFLENFVKKEFKTIIVSAHEEYGIQAVKAGAFDYLLKPLGISDLRQLVVRLQDLNGYPAKPADSDKINIPYGNGFKVIELGKLMYLESDNSYCDLHMTEGARLVVSSSIKKFEEILARKGFFRIHNRFMINLKFLESFSLEDGGRVTLVDDTRLAVSRRRLKGFKNAVKEKFHNLK